MNKPLIIETYWEEVSKNINPISKLYEVVKGVYYRKSISVFNNGWDSCTDFYWERAVNSSNFIEEKVDGSFKFNLTTSWGIHSYQLVYPCGKKELL